MHQLEVIAGIVTGLCVLAWRVEVIVRMLIRDRNVTLPGQASEHDRDTAGSGTTESQ